MTRYGTIPRSYGSGGRASLECITRATARIREGLGTRRPWREIFDLHSIRLPTGFRDAISRIKTNAAYFSMNYAIIGLLILFLSLLWHPISLIVFIVMMAAWLFLYFLRDEPLVICGRLIRDRVVLIVLSIVTIVLLLKMRHTRVNILVAVLIGIVVVVIHAALRKTDDFEYGALRPNERSFKTLLLSGGSIMKSIISSCFSWVPALCMKLAASLEDILRRPSAHLPDEIVVQILAKLPAKSILRCQIVCRRWKALISTREFVELQLKHSIPMIIVFQQKEAEGRNQLCLLDTCEATEKTTEIRNTISVNSVGAVSKSARREFLLSSNGLIVFREEFRGSTSGLEHYVLLNLVTREKVRLITPKGLIYGIYFSPFVKNQYCLLWGGRYQRQNGSMPFRILVLEESRSQSQSIDSHPQTCSWKELYDDDDAPFSYQPRAQTPPIIIDGVLYWMVGNKYPIARQNSSSHQSVRLAPSCEESIVAFDTKTEKFSVMPHPGPRDQYCRDDPEHNRINLVEMDDHGFLCLCEVSLFESSINIWILRQQGDGNRPLWIRWHRVNVDVGLYFQSGTSRLSSLVRPVLIVDGEVLLELQSKGLFALNFKKNTIVRKIAFGSSMYAHTPSFVPLSNCEPEILITT